MEKSRVVDPQKGERNFHAFYGFCRGASAAEKSEFGVGNPKDFDYLNKGNCTDVDTINDAEWWKEATVKKPNVFLKCI